MRCLNDTRNRLKRQNVPLWLKYELLACLYYGFIQPDQLPHSLVTEEILPRDIGADGIQLEVNADGLFRIVGALQAKFYGVHQPLDWGGACKFHSATFLMKCSGVHPLTNLLYVVQPHSKPTETMTKLWNKDGTELRKMSMDDLMKDLSLTSVNSELSGTVQVPRAYQVNAAGEFARSDPSEITPFKVSFPAGSGKSLVLVLSLKAALNASKKKKPLAIVTAPSRELVSQLADTINAYDGNLLKATDNPKELISPESEFNTVCLTHAMVRQFHKRSLEKVKIRKAFEKLAFVGVDEAHHLDDENNQLFHALQGLCGQADLKKYLCVSASFHSKDKINFSLSLADAEDQDVICPSRVYLVAFTDGDVLEATCEMIVRGLTTSVVDDHTPPIGNTTMVFWSTKKRAQKAAELLEKKLGKDMVAAVTGDNNDTHVENVLRALKAGNLSVVCCCQKFVEGVDVPNCDCVILGDTTQSPTRLIQAFGRANRKSDDKAMANKIVCVSAKNLDKAKGVLAAISEEDTRYKNEGRRVQVRVGRSTGTPPRAALEAETAVLMRVEEWLSNELRGSSNELRGSSFLLFEEAQELVKKQVFKSQKEFYKWEARPKNFPSAPHKMYKDEGWTSWKDFLGNEYLSFEEAQELVKKQVFKSSTEFSKWEARPKNFPADPWRMYKDEGWTSWKEFLGNEYLSFEEAQELVKKQVFKSVKEFKKWEARPKNFPTDPSRSYKDDGWTSWMDFLGF